MTGSRSLSQYVAKHVLMLWSMSTYSPVKEKQAFCHFSPAFPSTSMGSQCFGRSCHPPQLSTSVLGCRYSGCSHLYRPTLVNQPAEGEPYPESMHETKV